MQEEHLFISYGSADLYSDRTYLKEKQKREIFDSVSLGFSDNVVTSIFSLSFLYCILAQRTKKQQSIGSRVKELRSHGRTLE